MVGSLFQHHTIHAVGSYTNIGSTLATYPDEFPFYLQLSAQIELPVTETRQTRYAHPCLASPSLFAVHRMSTQYSDRNIQRSRPRSAPQYSIHRRGTSQHRRPRRRRRIQVRNPLFLNLFLTPTVPLLKLSLTSPHLTSPPPLAHLSPCPQDPNRTPSPTRSLHRPRRRLQPLRSLSLSLHSRRQERTSSGDDHPRGSRRRPAGDL